VVKSEPGSFGAELWSPISQHFPYFPRESGKVVSNLNLYTSVVRGNEGSEENSREFPTRDTIILVMTVAGEGEHTEAKQIICFMGLD